MHWSNPRRPSLPSNQNQKSRLNTNWLVSKCNSFDCPKNPLNLRNNCQGKNLLRKTVFASSFFMSLIWHDSKKIIEIDRLGVFRTLRKNVAFREYFLRRFFVAAGALGSNRQQLWVLCHRILPRWAQDQLVPVLLPGEGVSFETSIFQAITVLREHYWVFKLSLIGQRNFFCE